MKPKWEVANTVPNGFIIYKDESLNGLDSAVYQCENKSHAYRVRRLLNEDDRQNEKRKVEQQIDNELGINAKPIRDEEWT